MKPLRVIAVIPARGGTKGIPGKNLVKVGGTTLVGRTVLVAHCAQTVEQVYVSTDDNAIAEEAMLHGAEVIDRPTVLATDTSSSESALLHALDALAVDEGVLAFLQCTSPFTAPEDIDRVVAPVVSGSADSAFAATSFHSFVWRSESDGARGVNHDHLAPRLRRQDRPQEFLETGSVYAIDIAAFRRTGSRFSGRTVAVEVDARTALEIDEQHELDMARAVAPLLDATWRPRTVPKVIALDFDGVLTDDRIVVTQEGLEAVLCHRGDGHAIARLREYVNIVIFSTEVNPVVAARCAKLGVEAVQGLGFSKAAAVRSWALKHQVALESVLFVGNDVNDLETFELVGTAVAVADAVPSVRLAADVVLSTLGGQGVVRELADRLLPLITTTKECT